MVEASDFMDFNFFDFNEFADEAKIKPKTEEEIRKMCTSDDMSELKRSVHLLKKGTDKQMNAIITFLYRYMQESGANEELLSIILNSIEDWDQQLQTDCAEAFIRPLQEETINETNNQRILKQSIEILTKPEDSPDNLINAWIEVFRNVVGKVKTSYVQQVALKPIQELLNKKHPMPKRKKGIELATAMAMNVKPKAHDDEPMFMRLIMVICSDTDYKIRTDGAIFFKQFFQHQGSSFVGHDRYEEVFLPEIIELVNDEELYVSIEALEGLLEVLEHVDAETIEKEIMPNILKLIAKDNRIQEITVRMAAIIGKVVWKLSKSGMHRKYQNEFVEFYHRICDDLESEDNRYHAAYNLPCFHLCYHTPSPNDDDDDKKSDGSDVELSLPNEHEPVGIDFADLYLRFANDDQIRIREIIACSLHEPFKLMGPDDDTSKLRQAFHDLLCMEDKPVIKAMTKNFEKVIEMYANDHAIDGGTPGGRNGGSGRMSSGDRSPNIGMGNTSSINEGRKKKHVFLHSNTVNTKDLDSLVAANSISSSKIKAKDDFSSAAAKRGPTIPMREIEDNHSIGSEYLILPEYASEEVYSELLHKLLNYNNNLSSSLDLWREHVVFLDKLAKVVSNFHMPEANDVFIEQMFNYIQQGNNNTKKSAVKNLVYFILHQYDTQRRQDLIKTVLNDMGESCAFSMRKLFVFFCAEGAECFSRQFFTDNFYKTFVELAEDPVPHVRLEYSKALLHVVPLVETNTQLQFQLMETLTKLRHDKDRDVKDSAEHSENHLLQRKKKDKTEFELQDSQRVNLEAKLRDRELKEEEERNRRMNVEEESKYDFSSYLLKESKGFNRQNTLKNVAGRTGTKKSGFAGAAGLGASTSNSKSSAVARKSEVISGTSGQSMDKTPTKRKNGVTKRNSSALPSQMGDALASKLLDSVRNEQRKQSLLLPNGASIIDSKSGTATSSGGIDNQYKRYEMLVKQQAQQTAQAQTQGVNKRSQSLKISAVDANKVKQVKKALGEGITALIGKSTKNKNKAQESDEDNEAQKSSTGTTGKTRTSANSAFSKKY